MDKDLMITLSAEKYGELLEAKVQRDMLLNIAQNASSYNVSGYIKAAFNLNVVEPEE